MYLYIREESEYKFKAWQLAPGLTLSLVSIDCAYMERV